MNSFSSVKEVVTIGNYISATTACTKGTKHTKRAFLSRQGRFIRPKVVYIMYKLYFYYKYSCTFCTFIELNNPEKIALNGSKGLFCTNCTFCTITLTDLDL